jgi:hypothetical protein
MISVMTQWTAATEAYSRRAAVLPPRIRRAATERTDLASAIAERRRRDLGADADTRAEPERLRLRQLRVAARERCRRMRT